jgi:site-specific DNA-methyltransferase (adenine-specific)
MSLLFNGDCLEKMKDLDDNSIDLIFCDLPYGQTSCKWDCKIDLEEFWKQVMRIKKTNTPLFFTTTTKFGVELINSAPKKCPFRYDIVWVKSAPAGFLSAKKMPMRKHEMIYVFYEKLPLYDLSSHTHKFIKQEPKKEELDEKYKNKGGLYSKVSRNGLLKAEPHYDPPLPTTMLEIKSTRGKHSTEKPVALMEWVLKYYSKEGDVVLDPTMGSGSTGVACKNMNRNFIGIEKDPEIYEVAVNRIED